MKRKKIIFYLFSLSILCAGFFLFLNKINRNSVPNLYPRRGDTNISSEYINAQRTVDFYREQIEKNPDNPQNYVELAQVFIQEMRITGKHHEYLPGIENLIETALDLDEENLDANLSKASILLTLHRFQDAEKIGEWAVGKYPYSSSAYGVLVDAYVELGKYDKAVEMCDRMLKTKPDLRSYSRASYIREIYGDLPGAIDAMRMAADAGAFGRENRAWVLYNLANLFLHEGKSDTAAFIYNGILQERKGYANALSGLADVSLLKNNFNKAIEYLVQASQVTPRHIYLEKLADIYKITNQEENEKEMIKKVLEVFEQHRDDGYNVKLEYARFCLNHDINLEEALGNIKEEYKLRPGNIDVLGIYAWALYKNKKIKEAIPFIQNALRLNTKRSDLFYYAGMIFKDAGMQGEAVKYFEKVFKDNGYVNPLYVEEAKTVYNSLKSIALVN